MTYDPKIDLVTYKIEGNLVSYCGYEVKKAEAATFKALNSNWAVDAKHVFGGTRMLRGLSPATFQVMNELFARDNNRVYYTSGPLVQADRDSFRTLDAGYYLGDYSTMFEGYARDRNGIWFYAQTIGKPRVLKQADPDSFEVLPYGHARDSKHVFFSGLLIKLADPASFRLITQRYARDRSRVFYGDTAIEGADCDSFEVMDTLRNQAKDKIHLYECHRRVDAHTEL